MARKVQEKANFRKNLILYYGAIGVIIVGYLLLAIGDANSITSLTLGPIVLVIGYIIVMPIALLTGMKGDGASEEQPEPAVRPKAKRQL